MRTLVSVTSWGKRQQAQGRGNCLKARRSACGVSGSKLLCCYLVTFFGNLNTRVPFFFSPVVWALVNSKNRHESGKHYLSAAPGSVNDSRC